MENPRQNSKIGKNSKTLKTLDLGVSLQGTTFQKRHSRHLGFSVFTLQRDGRAISQ
jgi:hypothetical protein